MNCYHIAIRIAFTLLLTTLITVVKMYAFLTVGEDGLGRDMGTVLVPPLKFEEPKMVLEGLESTSAPPGVKISRARSTLPYDFIVERRNFTKVLVATTWRSGSTFFGEALSSHPSVFYHYEPLQGFLGLHKENGVDEELEIIRNLFQCNFSSSTYISNMAKYPANLLANNKIGNLCNISSCANPAFLTRVCKLFPVQVIKVVRLNIKDTETLLRSSGIQLIFLARDPRAIFASRQKLDWCQNMTACSRTSELCNFLNSGLRSFKGLKHRFPARVHLLKYEDLAWSPLETLRHVHKNLGVPWDDTSREYILSHTRIENETSYTQRKSRKRISAWRRKLDPGRRMEIEANCGYFMRELNYSTLKL